MGFARVISYILAVMVVLCSHVPAVAGIRVTQIDARLHIDAADLPDALRNGEWSLLVWVYAPEAVSTPSSLLTIGDRLAISADPLGVSIRVQQANLAARLRLDTPFQPGRWHLLAVSMDVAAMRGQAWLATDRGGSGIGELASDSGRLEPMGRGRWLTRARTPDADPVLGPWRPGGPSAVSTAHSIILDPSLQTPLSGLTLGAFSIRVPAAMLTYEALAIRDHALTDADAEAIWRSRDYYAVHSLDTRSAGGRMNGWQGCPFLAVHAVSPGAHGLGSVSERISYVGGPANRTNVMMVRRPIALENARSAQFLNAGPVVETDGLVFTSRVEPGLDGFFRVRPAPFEAPTEPIGTLGPKARMLAEGPIGPVRVMVGANSRGVRGTLPLQPWPEHFAHGFVQALLPQTAGVLMRPATLLDHRGGWFGLDTSSGTPDTTLVRVLHTRTDSWADFTRFGTGTLPSSSRGPGPAVSISPGGVYRLRCGPVHGSLLVADAPLVVRSTLLSFPGSSELEWYPERGREQNGDGLPLDGVERVDLDTTRVSREFTAEDGFASDTELVLAGVVDVRVDDAIVVMSGPARGSVSVVEDVVASADAMEVHLSHPFGVRPDAGAELRIGPWEFVSIEHHFDAVPVADDRDWRGQVLTAADDEDLGLMVYAISAWRPDVDGFLFGSAGQGGNGYTLQLDNSFPGSTEAWARETQADVWIQGIAGQGSQPSAMVDYLDVLRAGLGHDAEVVWASDVVHAHSDHENWHGFLRDHAADAGVAAIFAVGSPRTGSYFAQAASGMRNDDAHLSSFGNKVIAEVWLDQLRELASGLCTVADYNLDGTVDIFDFLAFQTEWQDSNPRADLDGDGELTLFDFLVLIDAIDECI